jgi:hypothetical protein
MTFRFQKRHKFNAKPVDDDGQHFSSKLEHRYYLHLKLLQKSGEVVFFLRQVPFWLPGAVTYRCDYQVFYADGTIRFIDCKGMTTDLFTLKKKQVEALYPVEIEIIKTKDF